MKYAALALGLALLASGCETMSESAPNPASAPSSALDLGDWRNATPAATLTLWPENAITVFPEDNPGLVAPLRALGKRLVLGLTKSEQLSAGGLSPPKIGSLVGCSHRLVTTVAARRRASMTTSVRNSPLPPKIDA